MPCQVNGKTYFTRRELAQHCKALGLNIGERTIRFWESEGLLPRPIRLPGKGNRVWHDNKILERLKLIGALRRHRSLGGIKQLLEASDGAISLAKWRSSRFRYHLMLLPNGSYALSILPVKEDTDG